MRLPDTHPAATYREHDRGDRLRPSLSHPRRVVLTILRDRLIVALRDPRFPAGGRVLDLGCGNSPYEPLFRETGCNYVKADLPGNPVADLIVDESGCVDEPDGSFKVVLSSQVLEHVERPQTYLREAYRLLATDGILLLSTHGRWPYHPDPEDYRRWTHTGLCAELGEAGFTAVKSWDIMGGFSTTLLFLQDDLARLSHRRLKPVLFWIAQSMMAFLEWRRSAALSQEAAVYLVMCQKSEMQQL